MLTINVCFDTKKHVVPTSKPVMYLINLEWNMLLLALNTPLRRCSGNKEGWYPSSVRHRQAGQWIGQSLWVSPVIRPVAFSSDQCCWSV